MNIKKLVSVTMLFLYAIVLFLVSIIGTLGQAANIIFWIGEFITFLGFIMLVVSKSHRKNIKLWILFVITVAVYYFTSTFSI